MFGEEAFGEVAFGELATGASAAPEYTITPYIVGSLTCVAPAASVVGAEPVHSVSAQVPSFSLPTICPG